MINRFKELFVGKRTHERVKRHRELCPLESVRSGLMQFEERVVPAFFTWAPWGANLRWNATGNFMGINNANNWEVNGVRQTGSNLPGVNGASMDSAQFTDGMYQGKNQNQDCEGFKPAATLASLILRP
jgi:hypothetical protein